MSDFPRLCGISGENPVGPGGQACPECFARIDHTARTNPYWWMELPTIDTLKESA